MRNVKSLQPRFSPPPGTGWTGDPHPSHSDSAGGWSTGWYPHPPPGGRPPPWRWRQRQCSRCPLVLHFRGVAPLLLLRGGVASGHLDGLASSPPPPPLPHHRHRFPCRRPCRPSPMMPPAWRPSPSPHPIRAVRGHRPPPPLRLPMPCPAPPPLTAPLSLQQQHPLPDLAFCACSLIQSLPHTYVHVQIPAEPVDPNGFHGPVLTVQPQLHHLIVPPETVCGALQPPIDVVECTARCQGGGSGGRSCPYSCSPSSQTAFCPTHTPCLWPRGPGTDRRSAARG